ncbi:hypothetical protein HN954_04860 [bacterium]|nr:hypothetical protein [bacterium]MBT6996726.1 hypothetical protein [bacterium]MBT7772694.1 hypothetical protein [bacterium]
MFDVLAGKIGKLESTHGALAEDLVAEIEKLENFLLEWDAGNFEEKINSAEIAAEKCSLEIGTVLADFLPKNRQYFLRAIEKLNTEFVQKREKLETLKNENFDFFALSERLEKLLKTAEKLETKEIGGKNLIELTQTFVRREILKHVDFCPGRPSTRGENGNDRYIPSSVPLATMKSSN